MDTKHTPGPWTNQKHALYNHSIRTPDDYIICRLSRERDAVLIAAAPDLLEACKKAVELRSLAFELLRLDPFGAEANRIHAEMNNITVDIQNAIGKAEKK